MNYIPNSPKHNKLLLGIPMYSERGQYAGAVIGNEWRKNIVSSWMLRKPPALAVDVVTLRAAMDAGAEWLVITNTETGVTYRASMATLLEHGFEFDRGFGLQRGLTLAFWDSEPRDEGVKPLHYKSRAVKGVKFNGKQLPLFEVNHADR